MSRPEDKNILTALHNLAWLLLEKGELGEAETHSQRALELRKRVLGPDHLDTVSSVNCLAQILRAKGQKIQLFI